MSQSIVETPNVFISYSWTNPELEEWVVELATRLMHDGINIILDKWNLKEGQDIYAFMESMVSSDDIDKVLIICDSGYKEKADKRQGGVGTETQIITPQIYHDANQEKFIPIIAERDETGEDFIPVYIATRLYIDLSSSDIFEENYDKLIRNIFKVPLYKKPSLGKPPEYLFDGGTVYFPTEKVLRQMRSAVDKFPNRMGNLWNIFIDSFIEGLDILDINISNNVDEIVDQIMICVDKSLPLKNDFINAIEIMCLTNTIHADFIIEFFEKVYKYTEFQGSGRFYTIQFDHYKFLIHELFLHMASILIREKKYSLLGQVLRAEYYLNSKERVLGFTDFRFDVESFRYHNEKNKLNRLSLHADILTKRAGRFKENIVDTDLLLYYCSKINNNQSDWTVWFPITYIYFKESGTLKLLRRLKFNSHYQDIKELFDNKSVDDLKIIIRDFQSDRGYSSGWHSMIPNIKSFITPEEICSLP